VESSIFVPPNLGLGKNTEIILGNGVGSLRGGAKRLELSIAADNPYDLQETSRKLPNGQILGEPMIVQPVSLEDAIDLAVVPVGEFHAGQGNPEGSSFTA
jgi:hypothetical protein